MPLMYRSMKRDGDRPFVEQSADGLGVRVAASPCPDDARSCKKDVHPDDTGILSPQGKSHGSSKFEGMSVSPDWRTMAMHRIPRRLLHHTKYAAGPTDKRKKEKPLYIWQMGAGDFVATTVADGLHLYPDSPTHGVIAPATQMHVNDYQKHLESTVDRWDLIREETSYE